MSKDHLGKQGLTPNGCLHSSNWSGQHIKTTTTDLLKAAPFSGQSLWANFRWVLKNKIKQIRSPKKKQETPTTWCFETTISHPKHPNTSTAKSASNGSVFKQECLPHGRAQVVFVLSQPGTLVSRETTLLPQQKRYEKFLVLIANVKRTLIMHMFNCYGHVCL